jgi:short chain dehydrogenase
MRRSGRLHLRFPDSSLLALDPSLDVGAIVAVADSTFLGGVPGGTAGLGVETARCLAAAGADVTITARSAAAGEKVAATITASGVKVAFNQPAS